jgi:hypothetical protein
MLRPLKGLNNESSDQATVQKHFANWDFPRIAVTSLSLHGFWVVIFNKYLITCDYLLQKFRVSVADIHR